MRDLPALLGYYLDCLHMESGQGVCENRRNKGKRWRAFPGNSEWGAQPRSLTALHARACPAEGKYHDGRGTLLYGWPLLVVPGAKLELRPVLLRRVELSPAGKDGYMQATPGAACINPEVFACGALTPSQRQRIEGRFAELDTSCPTAIERWIHDQTPWTVHQTLVAPLDPERAVPREAGVHHVAGFFLLAQTPYTLGAQRELASLREDTERIAGTALGALLGPANRRRKNRKAPRLVQVHRLDAEQRRIAGRALVDPLTVVTGPPGTGKTQVITAIVSHALAAGQSVLVASKNNRAVANVEQRMARLAGRPVLFRAGLRPGKEDLRHAFLEQLAGCAAAPNLPRLTERNSAMASYLDVQRQRDALLPQRCGEPAASWLGACT